MKRAIYFYSILLLFRGCSGLTIKEKIIDNYYLIASDSQEACNLSFKENDQANFWTIIDATVFAAGYNEDYMIVKQHPRTFPNPPDKKITNYYILPLKNGMDWRSKNSLMGPLTLEQFNEKRRELNIPESVVFTKEIEDLK